MKNIIAITIIFIFLFISIASAETSIKAEVDKASLTRDEILTYKITITSSEKQIPLPQIPKLEGFNVISQTQSSQISFSRSGNQTVIAYEFSLAPIDIGRFKLEPAIIKIKNKTYSTESFEIEIKQSPSLPQEFPPETEQPQITL